MPDDHTLTPAADLVATNAAHWPNETPAYRDARNACTLFKTFS